MSNQIRDSEETRPNEAVTNQAAMQGDLVVSNWQLEAQ